MKNQNGFSLTELLVVIAIIGIIAAALIMTYRDYAKRQNLAISGEELKSAISQAYNLSLAPEADTSGYGVHCAGSTCLVFKNSRDNTYDDPTNSPTISTLNLKTGVTVDKDSDPFDIFFGTPRFDNDRPYSKITYFTKGNKTIESDKITKADDEKQTFTLQNSQTGEKKIIYFNILANTASYQP